MAEKTSDALKQSMAHASNAENPIHRLLNDPKLSKMKDILPANYVDVAKEQYSLLLSDLERLSKDCPEKFKVLDMDSKDKQRDKKKFSPDEFTHDHSVQGLVNLLKMAEASEKEWNELQKLLNAKYFLKDEISSGKPVQSASTDVTGTQRTEPDSINNDSSTRTKEGMPHSSHPITQVGGAKLSTTAVKSTKQESKTDPNIIRGGSQSTGLPASKSLSQSVHGVPPSPYDSNMKHTFHGFTEGQRERMPAVGGDVFKQQNTSRQHVDGEDLKDRPIYLLMSRHGDTKGSADAEKEYQTLIHKQKILHKGKPVKRAWEAPSDIVDITKEQRDKSPILFGYLKNTWKKMKEKSSELIKKAVTEFIILTSISEPEQPKTSEEENTPVSPRSSAMKEDCPCASMIEIHKNPSQSERLDLGPIEKVLKKFELQRGKASELDKARGQFLLLVKRDDNFRRKFRDKYQELQVLVMDPEEYPYSPYQCLYDILRSTKKTDPSYKEVWKQYFHLVTSDQQYIIAEHCGQVFKTVYRKEIDSMVVPRKSYEELQNELVEKIKQIEELTTRLSKIASQQLTTGNPNIADLSDKHRPTKIGELYSELYDNEWSEAFEVIKILRYSNIKEESESDYFEDILGTLKDILMAAYEFSAERADSHLQHLKNAMISSITFDNEDELKTKSMRSEQKETEYDRLAKEYAVKYRKEAAVYTVREASKVFQQKHLERVFKENSKDPKVIAYIDKCVELTWYMRIQDPPMHLHCLYEKDTISRAEFAFHGRKGKTTSVCVWPALFLFRDGHLVTKGHVLPEP